MPQTALNWTLEYQPFGAQLLKASVSDGGAGQPRRPVLYLSPQSAGAGTPIRGGVPILFPQFNDEGSLPKHGFVRTANWRALESAGCFGLTIGPSTRNPNPDLVHPDWPHSAELALEIRAEDHRLELVLKITNTGSSPFSWTGGLHPYFALTDLLASRLRGLGGTRTRDRFHPAVVRQPEGDIGWDGQLYERLFDTAAPVELDAGALRLRLSMTGFNQWMVWNPGVAGAQAMKDLPDADWQRFVCVEPVIVEHPARIEPNETFAGSFRIEVLSDHPAGP